MDNACLLKMCHPVKQYCPLVVYTVNWHTTFCDLGISGKWIVMRGYFQFIWNSQRNRCKFSGPLRCN